MKHLNPLLSKIQPCSIPNSLLRRTTSSESYWYPKWISMRIDLISSQKIILFLTSNSENKQNHLPLKQNHCFLISQRILQFLWKLQSPLKGKEKFRSQLSNAANAKILTVFDCIVHVSKSSAIVDQHASAIIVLTQKSTKRHVILLSTRLRLFIERPLNRNMSWFTVSKSIKMVVIALRIVRTTIVVVRK